MALLEPDIGSRGTPAQYPPGKYVRLEFRWWLTLSSSGAGSSQLAHF